MLQHVGFRGDEGGHDRAVEEEPSLETGVNGETEFVTV